MEILRKEQTMAEVIYVVCDEHKHCSFCGSSDTLVGKTEGPLICKKCITRFKTLMESTPTEDQPGPLLA